jgi:hypothetical protein
MSVKNSYNNMNDTFSICDEDNKSKEPIELLDRKKPQFFTFELSTSSANND